MHLVPFLSSVTGISRSKLDPDDWLQRSRMREILHKFVKAFESSAFRGSNHAHALVADAIV